MAELTQGLADALGGLIKAQLRGIEARHQVILSQLAAVETVVARWDVANTHSSAQHAAEIRMALDLSSPSDLPTAPDQTGGV